IHSTKSVYLDTVPVMAIEADAIITDRPNLWLGIKTADCVPVLLVDSRSRIIAAIHAGWKGAIAGVISGTIKHMESLGAEAENILVAIGPSIHPCSYEVDLAFYQAFIKVSANNKRFFLPGNDASHFSFDLPNYVMAQLVMAGVSKIDNI